MLGNYSEEGERGSLERPTCFSFTWVLLASGGGVCVGVGGGGEEFYHCHCPPIYELLLA